MKRLAWFPLVALAAATASAHPAKGGGDAARLTAQAYTLHNGLRVILHEDHASPTVTVYVWYRVGSKDERPGRSGFAHLFEHLMFEGSKHVPEDAFDSLLEAAGGWNNGSTNADRTDYIEQVPSHYLPLALYLEADRMAGLWDAMSEHKLDNQRDVVKNERRQSYEDAPYGVADLVIQQALWPEGHGNHNLTIGTMDDLTAASMGDVEAFYRTYYVPNNAVLVIAGDLDVARTRELVDRYFAWMPRAPEPPHVMLDGEVEPLDGEQRLVEHDDVQVPKVTLTWRSPPHFAADTAELDLAAQILAFGKTSRLYRRLMLDEQLVSEVYAWQNEQVLGGEFQIGAVAREGVSPDRIFQIIDEEVAALAAKPPSADQLERARNAREAGFLRRIESVAARAGMLASYDVFTGSPDFFAEDLARYRAVTPEGLQRAVQRWLAPDARVVMYVLPQAEARQ